MVAGSLSLGGLVMLQEIIDTLEYTETVIKMAISNTHDYDGRSVDTVLAELVDQIQKTIAKAKGE
jgi:hypothetical protein